MPSAAAACPTLSTDVYAFVGTDVAAGRYHRIHALAQSPSVRRTHSIWRSELRGRKSTMRSSSRRSVSKGRVEDGPATRGARTVQYPRVGPSTLLSFERMRCM